MESLIAEPNLRRKLSETKDPVSLVDEAGNVLGIVLTPDEYRRIVYRNVKVPFSEEEIARRREEKDGGPLADVWKRLGVP